jgi:hypothetical protein
MLLGLQAVGLNYCLDLMVAAATELFDSLYTLLVKDIVLNNETAHAAPDTDRRSPK